MNHDPFKINEAILDLWRDFKAGEDYIERLEIRNASLVKELDELRASSFVTAVPVEEYEKLKAEVERLRKAGDAMAEAMWYGDAERSVWVKKFAETDWNAAKEGKPNV